MPSRKAVLLAAALVATVPPTSALALDARAMPAMFVLAAQSYVDVIEMLESAGYRVNGMKTTFLGRVKIQAQNRQHLREVVVSRSTGEIKSDRIIRTFREEGGETASRRNGQDEGTSSNSGSGTGVSVGTGGASASVGTGGASVSAGGASVSVGLGG